MPELSIIIVNFNVKHFLDQCLGSIENATKDINIEVIIVDNNSVDGSVNMIETKYPHFNLIQNKQNVGFAKANNQAIKKATGKYILLLNPDTLVEEDTFTKCISYLDQNPDTGALSVKMIDGKGKYLPESKRGFPTPLVAFYKIFGITSLFPKSKKFARYYLGHLPNDQINEVDILPGAFLMIRKNVLNETGMLDEDFFMYGEDIDMSYRIKKEGYKNIYFPETTIIHYKGESTKKGSLNYVMIFYNAMKIFVRKHYSDSTAVVFKAIINIAIYFRAFISILKRTLDEIILPALDILAFLYIYLKAVPLWGKYHFGIEDYYPENLINKMVPFYITIWIVALFYFRGYNKRSKFKAPLLAIATGTIVILVLYSLLPDNYRFSRMLILIGSAIGLLIFYLNRFLLHFIPVFGFRFSDISTKKIVICASEKDRHNIIDTIKNRNPRSNITGFVSAHKETQTQNFIGNVEQLDEIVKIHHIDEVIFSSDQLSSSSIIQTMQILSNFNVEFKIYQSGSGIFIGSNSIHTKGELISIDLNTLAKKTYKRKKRVLEIISSLFR